MKNIELLKKIEGKHTVETLSDLIHYKRQSTINLLSKLKKLGFVKVSRGSNKKRIYSISPKKFIKKSPGMFDIINKYSKNKVVPLYDHKVEGHYSVENALVDAILTKNLRVIIASLRLFNHINNWPELYKLSKKYKIRNFVGALYEISRNNFRVRKMPNKTYNLMKNSGDNYKITTFKKTNDFELIEKKWNTKIPFSKGDLK